MSDLKNIDFENLTQNEFENVLPDLFANGEGRVSEDPRLQKFLLNNPDCAALVRDLEAIAEHARSLFDEPTDDPSPDVWKGIEDKLKSGEPLTDMD